MNADHVVSSKQIVRQLGLVQT